MSSPASLASNDPYLWDFSSPAPTLLPESICCTASGSTATMSGSPSSSFSGSPASSLSDISPFAAVLRQMVATPSPGTAAAMVRSPPFSSGQLMKASGPNTAAATLLSHSSSSGLLMAVPGSATPAPVVCTLPSEQQLAFAFAPLPSVPALSCRADMSAGDEASSLQRRRFSGSPVTGLCRTGPGVHQMQVCSTKKQQVWNHGHILQTNSLLSAVYQCSCHRQCIFAQAASMCLQSRHACCTQ